MLITGRRSLSTGLRYLTDLLLLGNVLALVFLPMLLSAIYRNPSLLSLLIGNASSAGSGGSALPGFPADLPQNSYAFYLAFLYAAGLGTAWILLEGHIILRRLERKEPFTAGQSNSFQRMSLAFFWLALAFMVKAACYNTLLTLFCCLLFLVFGIVCLIFSDIFRQAWLVKLENELTI